MDFGKRATRTKAEYRSAVRSRDAIRAAYVALLAQKPPGNITVSDVVRAAAINRSTFYAHFENVRAIALRMEDEILDQMLHVLDDIDSVTVLENPAPLIRRVGQLVEHNQDTFRALLDLGGALGVLKKLEDAFVAYMLTNSAIAADLRASVTYQIRVHHFAGGIAGIYLRWLRGEATYSLEDAADQLGLMVGQTSRDIRTPWGPARR